MTENDSQRLSRIKPNVERRALIIELTRNFFREAGFLEVDTPIRSPEVAPEQFIVPFESEGWFLATSPELYMKRLLAAGYDRLFQISHCFRKGERGRLHNPEFTMLEWYHRGADYYQMIHDTELLVTAMAKGLGYDTIIPYRDKLIDIALPWDITTVREAFLNSSGWDPFTSPDPLRFDEYLVTKVIPGFPPDRPVVMLDYPAPLASLAKLKAGEPDVAERAEVFIAGMELANAFSELTDVREQTGRFRAEIEEIERREGKKRPLPKRFLEALPNLPPCGGIALGIDRLVMLFCDTGSIDDVMPFTFEQA
jgi:lysyl-tRNA synthetase class 2